MINAAGIIAYDLHKSLSKMNNSEILTLHTKVREKGVISYNSTYNWFVKQLKDKVLNILFRKTQIKTNPNYYFFDVNQNKNLLNVSSVISKVTKPDIIIAYFMGDFFTIKDLYDLQAKYNNLPVFLVMADMVYITGGCHYAWDCKGYINSCSNCPAIIEESEKHYAQDNLNINKELIDKMDIGLITLSSQDYEYAKQSALFKSKKISFVLGGINLEVFNYKNNQTKLKKQNGVPHNHFVILYGAVTGREKRKGVKYFLNAINYLSKIIESSNITIITIGNGKLEDLLPNTKFNIINFGYISNYNRLAEIYNIADVFITTTIQDSGPMMVNQSIACGTPVVCFDIGVARDIVIDGKTGFRVQLLNYIKIANKIKELIGYDKEQYKSIRNNCVKLAIKEFDKSVSAHKILEIINKK